MDGLLALVDASEKEKEARGILYTPHEILRQPSTWQRTHKICAERRPELSQFYGRWELQRNKGPALSYFL